jgi:hypothetical protein
VVRDDMKIPDISVEQLRPVVGRALGSPNATPLVWSCVPLGADLVNPITAGLFRVTGTAQVDTAQVRPWQVILKVSHHPDFAGTPLEHGYAEHPADWSYWRREVLAYRSGIPERFSSPLRPVRCWSVEDVDDRTAWLWLEDLQVTTDGPRWSLEDLAASAYDWGAFSAQGVALIGEVESQPWALRRFLRGWLRTARGLGADHSALHDGCWDHPLLRERLPAQAHATYATLMGAAGPLLKRLEALPRTVAHHDTHGKNVFSETTKDGRRTVAIDWSDLGTAPVGQDLGHFVALNLFLRVVSPSDAAEHEQTASDAYLEGLRAFGWHGDEDDVRFAALTTASVQILSFAACHIAWLCPDFGEVDQWPQEQADKQFSDVDTVMDTWCEMVRFHLMMGERAIRWPER